MRKHEMLVFERQDVSDRCIEPNQAVDERQWVLRRKPRGSAL